MYHQPAQTLFVAADAAVYLFCLPVFQLVHPIRVCHKLAAHGGALDMSIEKLLLHKSRVVQAAHPANGEIGILPHFVAELEETTGMTKVRVVCRRNRIFQRRWFAKVIWKLVTPARSSNGTKTGSSSTRSPS